MPAFNAQATIRPALGSLRAQTMTGWEAVIVDDGSTDGTDGVVAGLAAVDARIRLVREERQGASVARNAGLAASRGKAVLFLDADDLLEPRALEILYQALLDGPSLGAVHGAWARVSADAERVLTEDFGPSGDLFPQLARGPVFALHACLVRRELIDRAGGFDPSLPICEDWDLWQRIARDGALFGAVPERVARYRITAGSASFDGARMFAEGLKLIDRAHGPDPRAHPPDAAYAAGQPVVDARAAKLLLGSWCAGLEIARGQDGASLLGPPSAAPAPGLDPEAVVTSLFTALACANGVPPATWAPADALTPRRIQEFIEALEIHLAEPGFARRAERHVDRRMVRSGRFRRPVTLGRVHAIQVDVTSPLIDVTIPATAERVDCNVTIGGARLGAVELPACDGLVPAEVLADAIVAEFWWVLLEQFFAATVYPSMLTMQGADGWSLRRGDLVLASQLPSESSAALAAAHDIAGWAVLLQEIWNRSEWSGERFYDARDDGEWPTRQAAGGWVVVEASGEPFHIAAAGAFDGLLTIGGAAVGTVRCPVRPEGETVTAGVLRSALITASGTELCRVAVREGVLGRSLADPATLRERLSEAAQSRGTQNAAATTMHGENSELRPREPGRRTPIPKVDPASWPAGADAGPGWSAAVQRARAGRTPALLIARRSAPIGTSASRRATLPAAAASELAAAAAATGEPTVPMPSPSRVAYEPELVWRSRREPALQRTHAPEGHGSIEGPRHRGAADRHAFEALFARGADPWRYESRYEQEKYDRTLDLLPPRLFRRALEVGCAEGHFTARLAPRVDLLVAADISRLALQRAALRCQGLPGVSFVSLDIATEAPPGQFDLVVCSEVLYYVGGRRELKACAKRLAHALRPGGYLVSAHANVLVDEPDEPGFVWDLPFGAKGISETLAANPLLRPLAELRTPYYRINLLQRAPWFRAIAAGRRTPVRTTDAAAPSSEAASDFRPHGGRRASARDPEAVSTHRLPILAYHRIAADGPDGLASYRVSLPAFEEQLDYLSAAGFYSVSLEQWRVAAEARRPLPGRAIAFTFDDAYRDFLTQAWPALRRRGFTAAVFVVTGEVGRTSQWDSRFGEPAPLLDWHELAALQAQGVSIGSHTVTHRPLTSLPPAEVAREFALSRHTLQDRLGQPGGAIAYPYGDFDSATAHLAGASGFTFGLTCRAETCRLVAPMLELPRIEVTATMSLPEFIAALG